MEWYAQVGWTIISILTIYYIVTKIIVNNNNNSPNNINNNKKKRPMKSLMKISIKQAI